MRVPRALVARLPHVLLALALAVVVGGVATAVTTVSTQVASGARPPSEPAQPRGTAPTGQAAPPVAPVRPELRAVQAVPVAALRARIPADVLIVSQQRLPEAVVRRLVAATGASSTLTVASGPVRLGTGQTTALGVDPSSFRAWTPIGTAESDGVWRSVASDEGSVAHVVAQALHVSLGGSVVATSVGSAALRVGSFATTGLPGIGLVVDAVRSGQLGLSAGTGLLLSAPQRDPDVTAAYARDVVARLGVVNAVQVDRQVSGRWVAPTTGRVTSLFGPRVAPRPGASSFHEGLDIGAPIGTPIYAMSDGVVLYAGPASGFGSEVVLSHRGGVTTVYGHVSRILVPSGRVAVGQPIALVGNEGESTGPHLHTEVRVDDQPVDPLIWLRNHGVVLS